MTTERTLIVNAGSSSVKFRLYDGGKAMLDGVVDGIGAPDTLISIERSGKKEERRQPVKDYQEASLIMLEAIGPQPAVVAHRLVHGGHFDRPAIIDPQIMAELHLLTPLAPLHMKPALEILSLLQERTKAVHIACFDTMFHRSMPLVASTYAIPRDIAARNQLHRYGFHGIAYAAMAREAARVLGKPTGKMRIIACQLGSGSSVCAIKNGRSVDTSMGFTPLEGLVMGTRSGDIDPAIIPFLCQHENKTPEQVLHMLLHESGLKALAGEWDVRKLLAREKTGDEQARLALELYAYHVRKYIGAYAAVLGGVDLIILSGGVSRAPRMRKLILQDLEFLGVAVDAKKAAAPMPAVISSARSDVKVVVIEVDEQEEMFQMVKKTLGKQLLVHA